ARPRTLCRCRNGISENAMPNSPRAPGGSACRRGMPLADAVVSRRRDGHCRALQAAETTPYAHSYSRASAVLGNEPGERTGPDELRSLVRALDHGGSALGGDLLGVPARAERLNRIRREPQPSTELVQHGPHVG